MRGADVSGLLGKVRISAINLSGIELIDREDNTSVLEASALAVCLRISTVMFRVINNG